MEWKGEEEVGGKGGKDRRLVLLEVPLDLIEEVCDGVVAIQLGSILTLWSELEEHFKKSRIISRRK